MRPFLTFLGFALLGVACQGTLVTSDDKDPQFTPGPETDVPVVDDTDPMETDVVDDTGDDGEDPADSDLGEDTGGGWQRPGNGDSSPWGGDTAWNFPGGTDLDSGLFPPIPDSGWDTGFPFPGGTGTPGFDTGFAFDTASPWGF